MVAIAAGPVWVAVTFLISYAVLIALSVRMISPLIREGWQPEYGAGGWALWMTGYLMGNARGILFPLHATVFTRPWLRLAGITVGTRAELSTVVGLNRTTRFAARSFCADDVVLAGARSRDGWLHVAPITIGEGAFIGNGALIRGGTEIGPGSLIGVLTTAPDEVPAGTSWLGAPALELPRRPTCADASRTVDPPRRLIAGRAAVEVVRIVHPTAISVVLAGLVFAALDGIGSHVGLAAMVLMTPLVTALAAVLATAITIVIKWTVIGRYRSGDHPLWSWFVWRDEIVNTAQEQLAGGWLLGLALGTPVMRPVPAPDGCPDRPRRLGGDADDHRVRSGRAGRRRCGQPQLGGRDASVPGPRDADRPRHPSGGGDPGAGGGDAPRHRDRRAHLDRRARDRDAR